jgi:two-component system OmpR family sensor kinase
MLEAIAASPIVAWPLALTLATVIVSDRVRSRRRHELVNRALHELRRPLQALTLSWPQPIGHGRDHLGLALEALGELDRSVNGSGSPARGRPELVEARTLAADAVRRWRGPAASHGRDVELCWRASGSRLVCDRDAVARALDNLIANALEHGGGPIRIEGTVRGTSLRMSVADGPESAVAPVRSSRSASSARRGQGLRIVAEIAADHGGRFAACAHADGARAVIELPLADATAAVSR